MYLQKQFEEPDVRVLQALIRSHPLGTWVTHGDGELIVNHVPFLLDPDRGPHGTLAGHVSRSNPIWQLFSKNVPSVVAFQGAEAYITPSWYPSKHAHGKAVPTWNYAVVHAHGLPRAVDDRAWLLEHVARLTDTHEAGQARPWKVSDAPADYVEQMIGGIVGIEIPISKLVGKWKVSQNRPMADRLGVVAGLTARGDGRSLDMAALVERHTARRGED
ncbi:MAG: FMN-binding negative transcriptional regulator [Gammaproteobacteria bacterium]|nr:FMN-binding negative transcriptional regulator [Gammaproteobacteria bacterium]